MDWRNRIGLYGCYFFGMAGIGFILPFLPVYLKDQGFTNQAISIVWTLAALAGLVQFPIGLWSDRVHQRKPFLVIALAVLALVGWLLPGTQNLLMVGLLAVFFAENGPCRSLVESLAGAEATQLAPPDKVGTALGALRLWRPVGVVAVLLAGTALVGELGIKGLLLPVAVLQTLAVGFALLLHENGRSGATPEPSSNGQAPGGMWGGVLTPPQSTQPGGKGLRDGGLWVFVAAMVLFHLSAAPGGAYLGIFLKEDLKAADSLLPVAFLVMIGTWMLITLPAGRLADRIGRRPLLIVGWSAMTVRLLVIALSTNAWQVVVIQTLDGLSQGLFAVMAAAWVTDRLGESRRAGEAQVLVGSALVFGSALGPLLVGGFLVDTLGYRGMFGLLAGTSAVATGLVVALVPETLRKPRNATPPFQPLPSKTDRPLSLSGDVL